MAEPRGKPLWEVSPEVLAQREIAAKMSEMNMGFAGVVYKLDEVAALLRDIRDVSKPKALPGTFKVKINGKWCEAMLSDEPKALE
jgi:hypothetical protein